MRVRKWAFNVICLLLVIGLSGCGEEEQRPQSTVSTISSAQSEKQFDADDIKKQYADLDITVVDIIERNVDGRNILTVTFSVPINPASDYLSYIDISRTDGESVDGGWILSKSGRFLHFSDTQPETEYSVSVHQGLIAGNDKSLQDTVNKTLKTRKLTPHVAFANKGFVLPAKLNNGLPLISVNVNEVDIDFYRVKEDKITQFVSTWANYNNKSYYGLNQMTPFSALVHSGRFSLNPEKNTRTHLNIPVNDIAALQDPGLYYAVMNEAGTYPYQYSATYFVISDIGVHARHYRDQLDVHISSLKTGKPLANIKAVVLDGKSNLLSEVNSDSNGLASFPSLSSKARVLLAQQDDHIAMLRLNGPALDLSEFNLGGRVAKQIEPFIYGPRDLYRPGETAVFSALLRDADGQLVESVPLKVKIQRPDGQEVKVFTWHPQKLAYYEYELDLPYDAQTGQWRLNIITADNKTHSYGFKVEEFLPERMKLEFPDDAANQFVEPSADLKIPVIGAYLYGASAAGNRLSTIISIHQARSPIDTLPGVEFGHIDEKENVRRYELEDIKLDDDGKGQIQVPSEWKNTTSPLSIRMISSLYESGGRPVTRSASIVIWPADALVGIRPLFPVDSNPASNSQVEFEIVKAKSDGTLVSGSELQVTLIHEEKEYIWEYSDSAGWSITDIESHYPVYAKAIDISEGKRTTISVPVKWGSYRLEIKDPATQLMSSYRFTAGYYWGDQSQVARPDKVTMQLDKLSYAAGEIAKLSIISPHAGEGFVLVESDKPLWFKRISIPEDGTTIEIPIKEEWKSHNIYISAIALRPGDSKEKITPNRAMGLIHLPLDRQARRFNVKLDIPEKIEPNTTVTANVQINNGEGVSLPDHMMVTLAAVDVGVLSLTGYQTPDAYAWFFEPRRYGIDSRDIYSQVIESIEGKIAKQRFGGDAELARGGQKPLTDVQIVSLFSGPVKLSWDGKASIEFDIPEFNGRLRFMAVAFSDAIYGKAENELTVASPVVAELSMPRFLAIGDQSTVTLDVQNLSGETQSLTVNVLSSNPLIMTESLEEIKLDDGKRKILTYPVKADNAVGHGSIDVSISNGVSEDDKSGKKPIKIQRQWQLGIRPAYPAITQSLKSMIKKGQSISLNFSDIKGLLVETVGASLTIDDKPPLNLQTHLDSLLQYPYGCLEQTSSRVYPLLFATQENLAKVGITLSKQRIKNNEERLKGIDEGISRIITRQRSNGGFGLWSNNDPEEHWLTAYATELLLDARDQGIEIPESVLDKALERLTVYVESSNPLFGERYSQDAKHYTFAYKAYAAYILARVKRAPLGSLRTLHDHHRENSKSGLPLVHLGLALRMQGDWQRANTALIEGIQFQQEKDLYLGDYGSQIRDLTQIIRLLVNNSVEKIDEESVDIGKLVFDLSDKLNGQPWLSTQERNALFLTGIALAKPGEAWQGVLLLNYLKGHSKNVQELLSVTKPVTKRFDGDAVKSGIKFTSQTDRSLYTNIYITGYSMQPPKPEADKITVARAYYNLDGKPVSPKELSIGDLLLVHLSFQSDQRIQDGLVVDLLPAGFELENQNLENGIKLNEFYIDGKSLEQLRTETQVKHEEYRDDRYVAAIDLPGYGTSHLFYLVRTVTPGKYQIPPTFVEDMYRPYLRGIGENDGSVVIKAFD